jgi:probable rRNA maturation factor
MIEIKFRNIEEQANIVLLIKAVVEKLFAHLDIGEEREVSVLLSDDASLHELNREHRNEDHATDVLSFPNAEKNPESVANFIGDIAISLESAKRQAENAGHKIDDEVQLLSIHGLLHLLGYEHSSDTEKKVMWKVQNDVLDSLNVDIDREAIGNY